MVRPGSGDKPTALLRPKEAAGSDWLPDTRLSIMARSCHQTRLQTEAGDTTADLTSPPWKPLPTPRPEGGQPR
jgi:hypothetical protein